MLTGVKPGDEVVTAGQLKLRNGAPVAVNNSRAAVQQPQPQPAERVRRDETFHRSLHRPAGAGHRGEHADPGARPARRRLAARCSNIRRRENATITITTTYPGASPDTVAGFVTTPMENAVAQVNGIDYMTSTSQTSTSTITINLVLNHDPDAALTEISAKVNSVLNQLPTGTQQPVLVLQVGQTLDAMYIAFRSTVLTANQITDYVDARGAAAIAGGERRADRRDSRRRRISPCASGSNPQKLAAYGLTADRCVGSARQQRFHRAAGQHQGPDDADDADRQYRPARRRRSSAI